MSNRKPTESVRIEVGGRPVLEFGWKRLPSGESILFPRLRGHGKHLSVYFSRPRIIGRHVTHQYSGRSRHTRRKEISLGKLYRDLLGALGPEDDPPPRASVYSTVARPEWNEWWNRNRPRMIREPTDRPVLRLRGPLQELYDRAISSLSGSGVHALALDGLLAFARSPGLRVEDVFERTTERELSMAVARVGFSEDFTRAVILIEPGRLIDLRIEAFQEAEGVFSEAFGVEDYLDVFRRSDGGRQVLAELRRSVRDQNPPREGAGAK